MRNFIVGIILLILSVWLGLKIAEDPGLALFAYKTWLIEMPLWFAILAFLIVFLCFYLIIQLFDRIDTSFYRWKNWLRWRRRKKAISKTNRGLLELISCNWRRAEQDLISSIDQSDAPLINYLAAAKAAHEQREFDKRDKYLRQAYETAPDAEIAIGLTQAQLQFQQGQLEHALATLNHLRQHAPFHPVVLKLLERIYIHLSDWPALTKLLPSLYKARVLSLDQFEKLTRHLYEESFKMSAARHEGLNALQQLWQSLPRKFKKDPQLISCYVKYLLPYSDATAEAIELIQQTLKKTWQEELVDAYGTIKADHPNKQLSRAESWLKLYPREPVLFITLARLSIQNQLWGKAGAYLEDSIKISPTANAYFEYGKLCDHLGDIHAALDNYRKGLAISLQVNRESIL